MRYFACEPETSWGTAVTPVTRFFEAASESVQLEREYETLETFGVNSVRDIAELSSKAAGDVEIVAGFEGIGILYEYLFGSVSSVTSGTPETHTFPDAASGIPEADREDKSLTLEFQRDEGLIWRYPGAFITSLSHSFGQDASSRINVGFLAKTETVHTTTGATVSMPTFTPIIPSMLAITVDSQSVCARSINIEIENPMDEPYCMGDTGLSAQPVRSGSLKVTGSAELLFEDFTEYNKWGQTGTLPVVVTATGASGRQLIYTMAACRITQMTPHMAGRDRLVASMEWESIYNSATTENCVVTLKNGDDTP